MNAIYRNQAEVVQALLQHGCEANYVGRCIYGGNFTFCRPLEAAVHLGRFGIAQMLYSYGSALEFMHCFDFCYIIRSFPKLSEWVDENKGQPRSLSEFCRIALKDALTPGINGKAKQLPVPNQMKLYIGFYDFALKLCEE
jgi:hypothetical protein